MLEHSTGALLERCARSFGPDTAIVHGDRRITYSEEIELIRRTGRALLSAGLQRGDRVALLMADRPELLEAYYGALWAGLVVVPMNARLGESDHTHIVADSGARALIHDQVYAERADAARGSAELVLSTDDGSVLAGGQSMPRLRDAEPGGPGLPEVSPDDLLGVFYTGGTTGQPKGVAHSHRTFLTALFSEMLEMGLGERETFAHVAPLTHSGGLFVLPVWMRGGTNVILGGFDPNQLLDAVSRERITSTMMVPTMLYVVLDALPSAGADTSSLSTVIYGASPIGQERLLQAIDQLGPVFSQLYGQTEAPNQLTVLSKADHARAFATGDYGPLASCGRPVAIADVRLADDNLAEVPHGESGEIVGRGPHVMLRYWNRPEETASTVVDGWLRTGDIAKLDDRGYIHIVDRKKDMIISGGFNVYPKEVETALFAHPSVRDACVIGIPDDKWGEAVKAVVVADPSNPVSGDDLIAWVKQRKGSVLSPKSVDFVEQIPLTAVGKHDKPMLRSAHWGGRQRGVN
jgi:fatty-acyl-CoA synthase